VQSGRAVVAVAAAAAILGPGAQPARGGVAGAGKHREIVAARADHAPKIDGDLSDPAWARAQPTERFTQSFPVDGAPPTMQTSLRILFDDDALYIGVIASDPDPNQIVARLARRDRTPLSDDVSIVIDTRHDHDTGYWFWINAAGVLADGQVHDDNRTNHDWDAVWSGKAKIGAHGWTAELRIPYSILRFPVRDVHQWGLNVTRHVGRTKETIQWVHIPRTERGNLSRAGHIVGLRGLRPGRALELRPFAVVRTETEMPNGGLLGVSNDAGFENGLTAGLDLKYSLTNNLTLDATVFPDFGQVEADAVVLNLSTYETQFPEKRPFFLENADLFNTDIRLLYSRRIGQRPSGLVEGSDARSADGAEAEVVRAPLAVPIWAAGRVSGKISPRFTIAALNALTGPEKLVVETGDAARSTIEPAPVRNYTAARGKYSLGGSSYLGFIATALARTGELDDPAVDHDAAAESLDGRWVARDGTYRLYFQVASSHRIGGPTYQERDPACTPETCEQLSRTDGTLQAPGDIGYAGEFGGGKVGGEHWLLWSRYEFASPEFDVNDVGFENDWDYHNGNATLTYREKKPFSIFQEAQADLNGLCSFGYDGFLRDAAVQLTGQGLTRGFWSQNLRLGFLPSGTYTERETSDGARFERTDYVWSRATLATDSRRWAFGHVGISGGGALNDEAWHLGVESSVGARFAAPLELSLKASFNLQEDDLRVISCTDQTRGVCSVRSQRRSYVFADLDSGSLSLTLRGTLAMTPEVSLQAYAQMFAARGHYARPRCIAGQLGAHPNLRRDELEPIDACPAGAGLGDDDFSFSTVNANLVLRWEFSPGATLIGVYTRAQRHDALLYGARPVLDFSGLGGSATEEVILAKLTWYWSR